MQTNKRSITQSMNQSISRLCALRSIAICVPFASHPFCFNGAMVAGQVSATWTDWVRNHPLSAADIETHYRRFVSAAPLDIDHEGVVQSTECCLLCQVFDPNETHITGFAHRVAAHQLGDKPVPSAPTVSEIPQGRDYREVPGGPVTQPTRTPSPSSKDIVNTPKRQRTSSETGDEDYDTRMTRIESLVRAARAETGKAQEEARAATKKAQAAEALAQSTERKLALHAGVARKAYNALKQDFERLQLRNRRYRRGEIVSDSE